jgi:hypothetical protein
MAKTYEPIATTTLGSANTTITFSSIPATYTDLILVMNTKASTGTPSIAMRFNGDNGTNYSFTALVGNGSTASSNRATSTVNNWVSAMLNGVSSTNFNSGTIQIMNYSNTTTYKTAISRWAGADYEVDAICNLWRSTAAINQVSLIAQSNLVAGSTFTLYGIKAA